MEETLAREDKGVLMLLKIYLKSTPIQSYFMSRKWRRNGQGVGEDHRQQGSAIQGKHEISKSLNIFVPGWFFDA